MCSSPDKTDEPKEANQDRCNYVLNGIKVYIVKGDICDESVDAIVSGTDNFLANRNSSIVGKAGFEKIAQESELIIRERGQLQTGDVVYTHAGNLKHAK